MKFQLLVGFLLTASALFSQDTDRISVPFSDPARPRLLKVRLVNGSITVKGYDGKDAIVEGKPHSPDRRRSDPRADGLRRLDVGAPGLVVEEQDNVVSVSTRSPNQDSQLVIQVPVATSLQLKTVNGGNIVVENVNGELDVDNVNGSVTLNGVSGTVVAHALNGNVHVSMNQVVPGKPMSFSSLNGNLDVTLPPDIKARVKMRSDNGDVYSDFDIKLDTTSQPVVEDTKAKNGKYRVRIDRNVQGLINGGGQDISFTTLNGAIYIRKKK
jgi:hypothetical protein